MNKVLLMGRLVREPEVRRTTGENANVFGRYTLAVDRPFKRAGADQTADFINCVTFGKTAEFAEKYLHKGTKIIVEGRIQTGSYKNKDGQTVYTTDVVAENHEFPESKSASSGGGSQNAAPAAQKQDDSFMNIPDNSDEEMPWDR